MYYHVIVTGNRKFWRHLALEQHHFRAAADRVRVESVVKWFIIELPDGVVKMETKTFSDWTYLEVSKWLNENGLPQDICEAFEGEVV